MSRRELHGRKEADVTFDKADVTTPFINADSPLRSFVRQTMSAARPSALPRMVRPRPNISSELRDHKEHASVHYSRVATLDRGCLALHDTGRLLRSVKPSSFARGSIVAEIVKCQADIEVSSGHDLIFPSPTGTYSFIGSC